MNEQAIQEQYQHIVNLLEQKRLKEAQVQLEAFLWNCNDWTLRNRLEQAKVSYQYMLQYMRQGVNDPERQKLYRQLLAETWELAEQTRISLLDEVSTRYYHSLHKNKKNIVAGYGMSSWLKVLESFPDDMAVCQLMPDNKQSLDSALQRHEGTAQYLFLTTWGNSGWTVEEEQEARLYLESELLPVNDLCLFTRSASRGTLKKMMKSPNQSTMRSTTFSASAANRHWRSLKLKRESRRNSHGDQTKISVRRG